MIPFLQAKEEHHAIAGAAAENELAASAMWEAVTLQGSPKKAEAPYQFTDAVGETMGEGAAMLCTTDASAAVYAFACHHGHGRYLRRGLKPFELRDEARASWEAFDKKASEVERISEGFGWNLSLAWRKFSDVMTFDATEARRIADLAGRMYAALRGALAKRIQGVPDEVHSVELGGNIPRLLPSELAQLMDPVLETAVLGRIVEKRALQYAVRGAGEASKGPLVICLDESGSMHSARRVWSKSAALAIARVAHEQKRSVTVVHYSTSCAAVPLDPSDPDSVIAMIRHWYDGGTAIGRALKVARREVEAFEKHGQKGADVILITDGVDGDEASMGNALCEYGTTRLWTIAIECDVHPNSPLRDPAWVAGYARIGDGALNDASTVLAMGGTVSP